MSKMKKHIVFILVLVIILVSILGIVLYNKEHDITEVSSSDSEPILEISNFKDKLQESGIIIEEENDSSDPSAIGASEGKVYTIQEQQVQVYKYDLNSTDELTVSNIKSASEKGKIILSKLDNIELSVIYNKGLILITNFEDHPSKEKIIEIFKSL